jgi:deoxyribodipyrimidine photo-lyase
VAAGYLHNHARMWFASIWIFTLRLPWELGADFFLRHLLDGDPASNTLSWRWVGGIQTPGKTYLARPDNIARYTDGRFRPKGLATRADPLPAQPTPAPRPAPQPQPWDRSARSGLLLTEEDLSPGYLFADGLAPVASATLTAVAGRSPLAVAPMVHDFTAAALADCTGRWAERLGPVTPCADPAAVADWARAHDFAQIVTPYAPTGPAAAALSHLRTLLQPDGIALIPALRPFDAAAWPHATHGFFRFRDRIPALVAQLPGVSAA